MSYQKHPPKRYRFVVSLVVLAAVLLCGRALDLQFARKGFLQSQGNDRYLRTVAMRANRGTITDRNGEPLAISTPVYSIWVDPGEFLRQRRRWPELAQLLDFDLGRMKQTVNTHADRKFLFLRRQVDPELARRVMALGVSGLSLQREYRRYYPTSEVTAQVIGFTNIDDQGQEGIELAHETELRGIPGAKRIIQDRLGRVVENVARLRPAQPGRDLSLSLDRRLQYVVYRELNSALRELGARAGSVVILSPQTGEVLAMVNQPSFNPHRRGEISARAFRNRVATDLFEPGSTIKPFTVAAALESGRYRPSTPIDTQPGYIRLGRQTVRDLHNYGVLDVSGVIKKSSNVGASKIAMSLQPGLLWRMFSKVGFGHSSNSGFPGEHLGKLRHYRGWKLIDQATMAFGYGLSVTGLQLARAYCSIATDGLLRPLTFQRRSTPVRGERVMSAKTARLLRSMLELVVQEGTGTQARVAGYRVAGKTGTVHKNINGRYLSDRYLALFAGMVPASRPRLVAVVVVDEPRRSKHFGGEAAAPLFGAIMADAVRLMNIPPDALLATPTRLAAARPEP
ncbi:MAG: peptidoglycan D,D-transpeptidase FtsI family protein [Gammaproteobacteria bacterium]